jgi:hypothetical protein
VVLKKSDLYGALWKSCDNLRRTRFIAEAVA